MKIEKTSLKGWFFKYGADIELYNSLYCSLVNNFSIHLTTIYKFVILSDFITVSISKQYFNIIFLKFLSNLNKAYISSNETSSIRLRKFLGYRSYILEYFQSRFKYFSKKVEILCKI